MNVLTATQLAKRLGISSRRARDLLRTDAIAGHQLPNGTWLADTDSVIRYEMNAERGSGRTLDPATAWGLLWELSGREAVWLTARTRARVHRRIRDSDAGEITRAVSQRSRTYRYSAANAERAAEGVIMTGRPVAHLVDSDLIEDRRRVCGYVSGDVGDYAKSHFMVAKTNGQDLLFENTLPVQHGSKVMPEAVIAADLALSINTRERSAALRVLEELRSRWLANR